MHEIRPSRSMRTDVDVVARAAADAPDMKSGDREFRPLRVGLRYTNHHDGQGWHVSGTVSGPRILQNGSLGRQWVTVFIGLGDGDPDWAAELIEENRPPDQFDVGRRDPGPGPGVAA